MAGSSTICTLLFILVSFAFGQSMDSSKSGCKLKGTEYVCQEISHLPKNISGIAVYLGIKDSTLHLAEFKNMVVPKHLTRIEFENCTLTGLDEMVLSDSIEDLQITKSKIKNFGKFKTNNKLKNLVIVTSTNPKPKFQPGAFDNLLRLEFLILNFNDLEKIPVFYRSSRLKRLMLSGNKINDLDASQLENLPKLKSLDLKKNKFTSLRDGMFPPGNVIERLDFSDNSIKSIESNAFEQLTEMKILKLDNNDFRNLPTNGLGQLRNLSLKGVHSLRTIPEGLNSIQKVELAQEKSHLCCKVKFDKARKGLTGPRTFPPDILMDHTTTTVSPVVTSPTTPGNRSTTSHSLIPSGFAPRKRRSDVRTHPLDLTETPGPSPFVPTPPLSSLECTPEPTAFQPCENIMGADWLTALSFIIAPFALCGNFVVLVVFLCLARNYNVSRFLVTNLALADMSMGIYLLSLVIESVMTSKEYYLHVERFQFGTSCKVLGFLAMFSSELSLFSLMLITVERYLTIVYAMYPRYRLTMRTAVICMIMGWSVAVTVATLPIVGVGSYKKVAICLPFDTKNGGDLYLFFVFGLNGVGFLFICTLYAQIYRSVFRTKNSTPTRNQDSRVARRMALLVFTDFACFAPIAITGLSALLGHALIDVKQSKYLLVFFFPLNGLLNPFLYAIITKSFRRDLAVLLKNCFVCGGNLTNYISNLPARSVQSTNDVLSPSARPSLDFNAMGGFHSLGNIRGSRENPVSASFSKSEPNLVRFSQEALS